MGQHTNCDSYFCTGPKSTESFNLVPEAERGGMMGELQNIVSRLIVNAESLIENKTNNLCEQFNSIINKHIAGKRINFSGRRSYNSRVESAVISFNSKQLLRKIHKKMCNDHSPGTYLILISNIIQKKLYIFKFYDVLTLRCIWEKILKK